LGIHSGLVFSTTWFSLAQMHMGQYKEAHAQGQKGLDLARESGHQGIMGNALWMLGCVALVEKRYPEAQQLLQESVEIYQALGQQHEISLSFATLGYVERGLGNKGQAWHYLYQSLQAVETHAFYPLVLALPGVALLLVDQGNIESAVELYALALSYPYVANSRWFKDVVGRHIAKVAANLPPEVVAAAQARGQARDLWATAAELLAEFGD
jgi:tetratricopeptide (TPR) repeat protein